MSSAQADTELKPFVLPWGDAPPALTDLSRWNDAPAGEFGRVQPGPDGHLSADGKRMRFFGVDVAFDGNIPAKGSAPGVLGDHGLGAAGKAVFGRSGGRMGNAGGHVRAVVELPWASSGASLAPSRTRTGASRPLPDGVVRLAPL